MVYWQTRMCMQRGQMFYSNFPALYYPLTVINTYQLAVKFGDLSQKGHQESYLTVCDILISVYVFT